MTSVVSKSLTSFHPRWYSSSVSFFFSVKSWHKEFSYHSFGGGGFVRMRTLVRVRPADQFSLWPRVYSPPRNRDVNVLLPVAQPAPPGGGGTKKAAERKIESKWSTWDQLYGPIAADSRIHALLQQGAPGPEQALWACPIAAQRLPRWDRVSNTQVTFFQCCMMIYLFLLTLSSYLSNLSYSGQFVTEVCTLFRWKVLRHSSFLRVSRYIAVF